MSGILTKINTMLNSVTNGNIFGKFGIVVGSTLAALFTPIIGLLITCFSATIVDMFYGLRVARKHKRKIESKKNWKGTLAKLIDEFQLIFLCRLIEHFVLGYSEVFILTGGVTIIIALTEIWSIIENLNTLDPNGPWKILGKFLKKKGEDYVGLELELNNSKNDDDSVLDSKES